MTGGRHDRHVEDRCADILVSVRTKCSAPNSSKPIASGSSAGTAVGPAAVIELSDRAKALIAQNRRRRRSLTG